MGKFNPLVAPVLEGQNEQKIEVELFLLLTWIIVELLKNILSIFLYTFSSEKKRKVNIYKREGSFFLYIKASYQKYLKKHCIRD